MPFVNIRKGQEEIVVVVLPYLSFYLIISPPVIIRPIHCMYNGRHSLNATMPFTTQHPFSRGKKTNKEMREKFPKCTPADRHHSAGQRGRPSITPFRVVYSEKGSGTPRSSPPPPMFAILWCKAQGPDSTFPSHWFIARGYVCFGASVRQQRGFEAKALACEQPLTNT